MKTSAVSYIIAALRTFFRNDQLVLSILAVLVGVCVGGLIIVFREGYALIQNIIYGSDSERLILFTQSLPWWQRLLTPMVGGLVVGLMVRFVMRRERPETVADVIAANALRGGRMSLRRGMAAFATDCVSIGFGSSVGREGPAVHLGATIGGWIAKKLRLTRSLGRSLLGCGVAAAVAASFNAPIAGALFANEVVIGHYALSSFAPVVISSVTGTLVSRYYFGGFPAFSLTEYPIKSFWEFPAFVGLGMLAGVVAIIFIKSVLAIQKRTAKIPGPYWVRTTAGGALLGLIAVFVPEVLGVGYGTTEAALLAQLSFSMLLAVLLAKMAATMCCLGFGIAGGVFSPSLMIGALLGGAYGLVAAQIFPELASSAGAYAMVGMGAMAAAVLGAPISTAVIIFEMTSNYGLTIAVMLAVVLASVITKQVIGHSYFTASLASRGLDLRGGFETAMLKATTVRDIMGRAANTLDQSTTLPEVRRALQASETGALFVLDDQRGFLGTVTLKDLGELAFEQDHDDLVLAADVARPYPSVLYPDDDLDAAMHKFRETGETQIPIVDSPETRLFVGTLNERDAFQAYTKLLKDTRGE